MLGGTLSTGVTKNVHVATLPLESAAVMVTWVAEVIVVPATGDWVTVILAAGLQLSLTAT